MTQLIASNQLTLTNVNDGKTPYVHFAYADNADGTGLTLTDNGQRYIGNYSDYTQDDSTDKTKYTWADRWAKIEVGGRNLLKDQSKDWINVVRPAGDYYFQEGSDYKVEVGQTYTFSIVVEKVTNDAVPINLSIGLGSSIGTYTWGFPTGQIKGIQMGKRISITFTVSPTDGLSGKYPYFAWRLRNERLATTIRYKEVKLEKGTVATDWSPAPEDLATVAVLENKVKETADSFSRTIDETKALIPTFVGGRNLLKDQSKDWIEVVRPEGDYYFQKGSDYKVEVGQTYTFSIVVEKVTNDAVPINLSIGLGSSIGTYTWGFPTGQIKGIQMGKRISITFTVSPTDGVSGTHTYFAWRLRNERLATTIRYKEVKLEKGTVATDWSPAPEDIEKGLDSKADQALTQQQLNMLIEKSQQMQTELEARAAMETLSDLERAYKAYVEANDKAVAKSQADLIEAGRRVEAMVETLGGLSKTKTFIDTYIKEAEEGIIIGTNDNVSQIRITYDRIAMYSAGKEVMYISQGVIHIDNGVFTKTLQIGRFRTEQHQTNLDINVCRYVG